MRPVVARALLGGSAVGGWIVLGTLGPRHAPLWAGGLLPLALWLAAMGATVHAAGSWRATAGAWRAIAVGAGAGTLAAIIAVVGGDGGAAALCLAATGWGVGLGAAEAVPERGSGRRRRSGLLDCALPPSTPGEWRTPSAWGLLAARWSMLPMMATLGQSGIGAARRARTGSRCTC